MCNNKQVDLQYLVFKETKNKSVRMGELCRRMIMMIKEYDRYLPFRKFWIQRRTN